MINKTKQNRLFSLKVGTVVIGLVCPVAGMKEMLEQYFYVNASQDEPDILIKLKMKCHSTLPNIPDSFFVPKKRRLLGFSIDHDLVRGHFFPSSQKGVLKIKRILTEIPYTRVFEQLLYQAYYSAVKMKQEKSYLVHSSGVIARGEGYLFVGASGMGKSTVAELSQEYQVLNDEINIISLDFTDKPMLVGTPFNGLFKQKQAGLAPCKGIFLLNHGQKHEIREVQKKHAVKVIAKEIIPFIGLEDFMGPRTLVKSFDIAEEICDHLPVYNLFFKKDKGFWSVIKKL